MKISGKTIILFILFFNISEFFAQDFSLLETPKCIAVHTEKNGHDHEVHSYSGFTLCYREEYECAEWVCYKLTKEKVNGTVKRSNMFHEDYKISTGSAWISDYKKSGYDRGHLAPAGSFKYSEEAMFDTFAMSNITPQVPEFNQGIWNDLENQVRNWARKFGEIYVVTGPVLEKPASEYSHIGFNQVAVPEYFYKVILRETSSQVQCIAFIIPNQPCSDSYWNYVTTVDDVEQRTGIDFFFNLDDAEEEQTERQVDLTLWGKFNYNRTRDKH